MSSSGTSQRSSTPSVRGVALRPVSGAGGVRSAVKTVTGADRAEALPRPSVTPVV
jgi:hypothetical protein